MNTRFRQQLALSGRAANLRFRRGHACYCTFTVEVAGSFARRFRGLLGRARPAADGGLLLVPCRGIHTVGMRYPVDAVFIDAHGNVLDAVSLVPWQCHMHPQAVAVMEIAGGMATRIGINGGDRCEIGCGECGTTVQSQPC